MKLSVITPARNAQEDLPFLLKALLPQLLAGDEAILIDDASTDRTPSLVESYPVRVLCLATQSGPAAARNLGAKEATGDLLLFLDADVVPHADLVERIRQHFAADSALAAVIGSYDDRPASNATVSRFRNLLHCYTHRTGNRKASTFWAGCGAMRRDVFEEAGGFDQQLFRRPSIEDIELGVRICRKGRRIVLDPDLQVQHRKIWTLRSMIRTDVWCRAVPWSRLILRSRDMPVDLNLKIAQRVSAPCVALGIALFPLLWWFPVAAGCAIASVWVLAVALNLPFYRFLAGRGGWSFALRSIPLHFIYFLAGLCGFAIALLQRD